MSLGDLRLQPVAADRVKPEDKDRKVAAAAATTAASGAAGPAWPLFDLKQQRGTEWTCFVARAAKAPTVDGNLADWDLAKTGIAIDGSFVPKRGWASPPPESPADLSARVALSWDDKYLYLAAAVRDDEKTPHAAKDAWGTPFGCDSLVASVAPPGWLTQSARAQGVAPLLVSYGLSYYSAGAAPRPLAADCKYVVTDTKDGYTIEAALSFVSLGWAPGRAGDRFPFGLILVDVDPHKPGGKQFDQYGWNYGPGSMAGMGEVRLMAAGAASGEIIPERDTLSPGAPLRYVGTIDAFGPALLQAIEVVPLAGGAPVAKFDLARPLPGAGRYRLWGQLPLPDLPLGGYDLRLVWK